MNDRVTNSNGMIAPGAATVTADGMVTVPSATAIMPTAVATVTEPADVTVIAPIDPDRVVGLLGSTPCKKPPARSNPPAKPREPLPELLRYPAPKGNGRNGGDARKVPGTFAEITEETDALRNLLLSTQKNPVTWAEESMASIMIEDDLGWLVTQEPASSLICTSLHNDVDHTHPQTKWASASSNYPIFDKEHVTGVTIKERALDLPIEQPVVHHATSKKPTSKNSPDQNGVTRLVAETDNSVTATVTDPKLAATWNKALVSRLLEAGVVDINIVSDKSAGGENHGRLIKLLPSRAVPPLESLVESLAYPERGGVLADTDYTPLSKLRSVTGEMRIDTAFMQRMTELAPHFKDLLLVRGTYHDPLPKWPGAPAMTGLHDKKKAIARLRNQKTKLEMLKDKKPEEAGKVDTALTQMSEELRSMKKNSTDYWVTKPSWIDEAAFNAMLECEQFAHTVFDIGFPVMESKELKERLEERLKRHNAHARELQQQELEVGLISAGAGVRANGEIIAPQFGVMGNFGALGRPREFGRDM